MNYITALQGKILPIYCKNIQNSVIYPMDSYKKTLVSTNPRTASCHKKSDNISRSSGQFLFSHTAYSSAGCCYCYPGRQAVKLMARWEAPSASMWNEGPRTWHNFLYLLRKINDAGFLIPFLIPNCFGQLWNLPISVRP